MKKPNWGTSIVIAFALFISFILYFIIKVQSNSKYDNELVVEEYYKKDTRYSEEIAKMQNAAKLIEKPSVAIVKEGVEIIFPKQIPTEHISGEVSFYRPSAKKLDFTMPLQFSGQVMLVPKKDILDGRWNVTLSWKYENKDYLVKKELYYN